MLARVSGVFVAVLLVVGMLAVGGAPTRTPAVSATQSVAVSMQFNRFVPDVIAVAAGTTVTWINEDYAAGETHDVIAESGAFASEVFEPGSGFSFTFFTPGTYTYYCDLHEGMYGSVIVQ